MVNLKVGDVVRLKSSFGQVMTVEGVSDFKVDCVWFDDQGNIHRQIFPIMALVVEGGSNLGENLLLG